MTELCHDALARGVLEQHEGLPPSWLALFQEHPEAWRQLTQAALSCRPPQLPFSPDRMLSITFITAVVGPGSFRGEAHVVTYDTVLAPARVLPKWFFILLDAWLEATRTVGGEQEPDVAGNGAYHLPFDEAYAVVNMWDVVREDCYLESVVREATLELLGEFNMDVRHTLEYYIESHEAEGHSLADADDAELVHMFERQATDHVRDRIEVTASDLDPNWFERVKAEFALPLNHVAHPAPFATLWFNWSNPERDW